MQECIENLPLIVSSGLWGDSSDQEDLLRCGWGPQPANHCSHGNVPADFPSGCCSGRVCPSKKYPSWLDFQIEKHFSDGGLLRVSYFVCEPGLGRRVGPSDRIPGGPQSLDEHRKTHPLVGRLLEELHAEDAPT